jgi:Protein of unknown function (DUF2585)
MGPVASGFDRRSIWPWLAIVFTLVAATFQLDYQGRLWLCSCGQFLLWVGEARSSNTSQHLLDPYSFTHVLHGFVLFWLLGWLAPRLSWTWRLWLAVTVEAVWETIENSDFVIQRYREAGALGYFGDTIVNSLGDLAMCCVGFVLARSLGFGRSLALFVAVEVGLLFWIRNSLILNVVTLIYPMEWIEQWQAGY